MNKLLNEGYELVVGSRGFAVMNRDLGHGIAGKKHWFNAPKDYTPGKDDDLSKSFHKGSLIINERKEVFMCVDETEGKANWIIMGSLEDMATKTSWIRSSEQPEPAPAVSTANGQPKAESDVKAEASVDTEVETQVSEEPYPEAEMSEETEQIAESDVSDVAEQAEKTQKEAMSQSGSGTFQIGTESGPQKGKTAIPDDLPYGKFLTEKNGLKYIEQVQQHLDKGTLVDLKYMNADRAEQIANWLDKN